MVSEHGPRAVPAIYGGEKRDKEMHRAEGSPCLCRGIPGRETGVTQSQATGRLMVDAPVRMFHALFGVCFLGAWLTSESESWRSLHVTLGYNMAGLLLFRIAYGLFGPQQARLSSLFGRIKGLKGMVASFISTGKPEEGASRASMLGMFQNSSMALAILALIVLAVITCLSGYLAWMDAPEWVAELHEEIGEALISLGFIHIVLVLVFSLIRRRNLALTMLSGKIAGPGASIVRHNRAWLAWAMLIAVGTFSAYDLQQKPAEDFAGHDSALVFEKGGKYAHSDRKEEKHEKNH